MNPSDEEFELDLTEMPDTVPVEWLEADAQQQREEWAAEAERRRAEWAADCALTKADQEVELVVSEPDRLTIEEPVWDDDPDAVEHARAVARAVELIRVREDARRAYAAETASVEPFDAGLLAEVLARAPEPLARIEGLMPWQAALLLIAEKKAGKTTLSLGAARSFITGEDLLGTFKVRPIAPDARVGFLNHEVSAATFARWADEAGIPRDRFYIVNLRGRRNPFKSDADLDRLGKLLREQRVESLFVDPFGKAFDGESQDDNSQVGRWLDRLDTWARGTVGALDIVLTAHAGHQGEHVRGASVLEGWADVNAYLTRDGAGARATRYLRAEGRDVDVPKSALSFDAATRRLALAAGSATRSIESDALDTILRFLTDAATPVSGRGIHDALDDTLGVHMVRDAIAYGHRTGRIDWEKGPRNAKLWRVLGPAVSVDDGGDDNQD